MDAGLDGYSKQVANASHGVRMFAISDSYNLSDMRDEIFMMTDVLLGRIEPPIDVGVMTLMEVAEAFHARASEMEMVIRQGEIDGNVTKGSKPYQFRTGPLRSFIELTRKTIDLGSRRITIMQLENEGRG